MRDVRRPIVQPARAGQALGGNAQVGAELADRPPEDDLVGDAVEEQVGVRAAGRGEGAEAG